MASSSSFVSDSQYCPRWKYNVFLSFRGEDTRKKFTGHLYSGLKNRGIQTFQDDKRLKQGDYIPEELLKAIEESQVALVIFSKNYATSSWCLNELVKIMECKEEENGQIVIPIFYDVDPSHVRYQRESFAEAFAKHESRYKDDVEGMQKVQAWRTALTTAANLKGYNIRDEDESEKIQQIVDYISSEFWKSAPFLQDIVGINAHLEKLKSRLQIEINDVRVLGIWGIGGVGKTTIAKALFDTLSDQFTAACFLANVKENARKNQLHSLQNTLLSDLLRKKDDYVHNEYDGKSMIRSRLCSMKVLIVLDDIDHHDHLEYLAGDVDWFGNGSRVVVTTRDRHLIEKDDAIYEVPTLPDDEAMQLFNQHAFKKEVPEERFKEFSLEVVNHAKGLPLALKVWGSLLHKKGLTQWRSTVAHIKKNSNSKIVEKLKISYDGLEPEEQKIFLDIACFFRGDERKEVMQILESCGFEAEYRLYVLIDKSLVFISEYDRIEMHDLIEDMGKYIVKMEKDSEKPSRIWNFEDFEDVMVNNTGTMAVEAIWFSYSSKKLCFSVEAMTNMQKLRILCIEDIHHGYRIEDVALGIYRALNENYDSIEYLSNNLCWFVWHEYPWKLLPQNFNPRRLVHLDLGGSALHYLWNETKQLPSLRSLDLRRSKSLKRTPDFTGMPNLEYLDLSYCESLEEVHHSLGCCRKLILLKLINCVRLERLPYVNVESLESLSLDYCSSLEKLPEILGIMKPELKIMMLSSGIREIPPSIIHPQAHLTILDLSFMNNLVSLPSSICKLKCLVKLDVPYCSKLESLPEEIGDLENMEYLDASYTLISRPPSSLVRLNKLNFLSFARYKSEDRAYFVFPQVNEGLLSLEKLNLRCCNLIDGGLPEDIGSLSSLKELILGGNNFENLPQSIAQIGALQTLDLSGCSKLKELPDFTGMPNLETLNLSKCNLTDGGFAEDIGSLSSLKELILGGNNFEHLPRSIAQLGALRSLDLSGYNKMKEFPGFTGMPNLETLNLSKCNLTDGGLVEDIGSLFSLKKLNLSYCNLTDGGLPEDIGSLSSLELLNLSGNNFEYLPRSIAQLGALRTLDLSHCSKLKELPDFTGMTNLHSLDLSYRNLTEGGLPEDIGSLSSLEWLYLSCCNLTDGGLLEDIGSLSSLKCLYLNENNFEYLPRSIAQLGPLQILNLSYCTKLKELPDFTGMTNLYDLNLSYCNLTDGGLAEDIGSLSSLKWFHLSGNNFEYLPRSIAQLGALIFLDLSNCSKLKELPDFTGMTNLYTLNLSYCNLTDGGLPEDIGSLSSLEWLYLSYCNLTDGGLPEDIGSLSSLERLNLSGNNFEYLPRSIAQLGALRTLDLSHCSKLKELPDFTGMTNLSALNLSYCNLTDGGLAEDIGSLSSLKELILGGNNFEHLPRSIAQLGALQSLDLSGYNKLKDFPGFTGMPNLETLNLSKCNLTDGGLAEDIGSLSSLKKLNLSYCNLTYGGLPEDIGSLSSLELLNLSGNNFEYLPRSIAQLGALRSLDLSHCSKLKELPYFTGMTNLYALNLSYCNLTDGGLLEDIGSLSSLNWFHLSGNNFEYLPRSIAHLGALRTLDLSHCRKLKELPDFTGMTNLYTLNLSYCNLTDGGLVEDIGSLSSLKELNLSYCNLTDGGLLEDIGSLSSLEWLNLSGNNFEYLPRSIAQLGALRTLDLSHCSKLKELPAFTGMTNVSALNLSYCNLTDGGLAEDIGSLSSLEELDLSWNNFEHLPRSIAQLGALQFLDLSHCSKLKELPDFTGMTNLYTLNLSYCNLTDGGLAEDLGSSLKKLNLSGNNFEYLPPSIAQLGALRCLDLSHCNKLTQLPEFPQKLHIIKADWNNDSICTSLFRNISSLQHDISVSDSLSLRVFTSWRWVENIPSWFHYRGTGTSVSVNLPENWYVSDKFLGFAVCYKGKLIDITAHLCDDEMTQKFALSNHSIWSNDGNAMHFFLVPLAGLWDASKANGKTPNDYENISLFFREVKEFGVHLLYKDEPELHIGIRRSRYEEACCCFPLLQLFPTRPGL